MSAAEATPDGAIVLAAGVDANGVTPGALELFETRLSVSADADGGKVVGNSLTVAVAVELLG